MEKYEQFNIRVIYNELKNHKVDEEIIEKIMEGGDKIKSKTPHKKKCEWCYEATNRMDELLDEDIKLSIRENCACRLKTFSKECDKIRNSYSSVQERLEAVLKSPTLFGNILKVRENGKFDVIFWNPKNDVFKCVCMKNQDKVWSKTWCQCCAGHIKLPLEKALGVKVKAKIISTALSSLGKENCHIELEIVNEE